MHKTFTCLDLTWTKSLVAGFRDNFAHITCIIDHNTKTELKNHIYRVWSFIFTKQRTSHDWNPCDFEMDPKALNTAHGSNKVPLPVIKTINPFGLGTNPWYCLYPQVGWLLQFCKDYSDGEFDVFQATWINCFAVSLPFHSGSHFYTDLGYGISVVLWLLLVGNASLACCCSFKNWTTCANWISHNVVLADLCKFLSTLFYKLQLILMFWQACKQFENRRKVVFLVDPLVNCAAFYHLSVGWCRINRKDSSGARIVNI